MFNLLKVTTKTRRKRKRRWTRTVGFTRETLVCGRRLVDWSGKVNVLTKKKPKVI